MAASYLPARRAGSVDPMRAMRTEGGRIRESALFESRLKPNRLRTLRGRVLLAGLFCAFQRRGGRSYAQKKQKATLP
jgi:hypothetical protein